MWYKIFWIFEGIMKDVSLEIKGGSAKGGYSSSLQCLLTILDLFRVVLRPKRVLKKVDFT